MAEEQKKQPESGRRPTEASSTDDAASKKVQELVNAETDQGFSGVEVDQTPNSAYTVGGVIAGEETPETDRSFPGLSKDRKE